MRSTHANLTVLSLVLFVAMHSAAQDLQTLTLCGGSGYEEALDMVATSDGGFVLVGKTTTYGAGVSDQTPNSYMVKFDGDGSMLWTRVLGGSGQDGFCCIEQAANGDLLVGGYRYLNFTTAQATLFRFTAEGDPLWMKYAGIIGDDLRLRDMISIGGDSLALACDHYTNGAFYNGKVMLLLADGEGSISTITEITASAGTAPERIVRTSDGGYAVLGSRQVQFIKQCALMKMSATGELLWNHVFADPQERFNGYAMTADNSGGLIVLASSGYGQTVVLRLNGGGQLLGQTGYLTGVSSVVHDVKHQPQEDLLAFGHAQLNDTTYLGMTLALDTNGTLLQARFHEVDTSDTFITTGVLRPDGGLALAGIVQPSLVEGDLLLLQTHGPEQGLGSDCADRELVMDTLTALDLEITSPYSSITPAAITVGDLFWAPGTGGEANVRCTNVSMPDQPSPDVDLLAYPNPVLEELHLRSGFLDRDDVRVHVLDQLGREVLSSMLVRNADEIWHINVIKLPPGLYTATFQAQGQQAVRFVKE